MKNLIVVIFIILSFTSISQVIDYANFNNQLFETKMIEKINQHRTLIGLKCLYTSSVMKSNISDVTSMLNSNKDQGYHPGFRLDNDTLNQKIYKDFCRVIKKQYDTSSSFFIQLHGEIISVGSDNFETYDGFVNSTLNAWLNSPKHKSTIESTFTNFNNISGMISCSIKKSKTNNFYTTVNFISVGF